MRRLLPFIILILLVIGIVCLPFLLPLQKYRSQIADHFGQRVQHPVLIGRLELALFPPALRLRDVNILSRTDNAALVRVDQILAPISWLALLKGQIAPQSLHLTGWTATVQRKPDGTWAWEEWLIPAAQAGGSARWPLKAITFDRGECHAVDLYGPAPERFIVQILQGAWKRDRKNLSINGVFTSLPAPVSFLFQASGQFLGEAQWAGVLGLTESDRQWKLECKVAGSRFQATARSDAWRFDTAYAVLRYYARLPVALPATSPSTLLQGWEGQFDQQGSILKMTQTGMLGGGSAEASGTINWGSPSPTATAQVALKGIKLEQVESALWGNAPLEGIATGLAHWSLALSSSTWSTMGGEGALEVVEGRYYVPASSLQKFVQAHTLRYLKKKAPDFPAQGMPYKKASVQWKMHRGVVSFDNAFCDLGDIQLALAGSYDAARRGLDAYARVQIRERNPQLLAELPTSYIYSGEGKSKIQPMHGRLQGTPAEWQLRAVRGSKIPPAISNKLSRTIKNK